MAVYFCLLALCLHIIAIESYVLKPQYLTIPPEGISFEVKIKPDMDSQKKGLKMEVSVKDLDRAMQVSTTRIPSHPKIEPTIENRNGVRAGTCPTGYVKRGGFCFPDTDY